MVTRAVYDVRENAGAALNARILAVLDGADEVANHHEQRFQWMEQAGFYRVSGEALRRDSAMQPAIGTFEQYGRCTCLFKRVS